MPLVDAALLASPLALTIAGVVTIDRRREARRRVALNRALHELRRPLHFLALVASAPPGWDQAQTETEGRQLAAALSALSDLDAEINGRPATPESCPLPAGELVEAALRRWRSPALLLGRELELDWRAGGAVVIGERTALDRALDNLVANSLEHGAARVRIEGSVEAGRLRLAVANPNPNEPGAGCGELAGPLRRRPAAGRDPRRGHGLEIVSRIAAAHGGRFAFGSDREAGSRAVLELPLAAGVSSRAVRLPRAAPLDAA